MRGTLFLKVRYYSFQTRIPMALPELVDKKGGLPVLSMNSRSAPIPAQPTDMPLEGIGRSGRSTVHPTQMRSLLTEN